MCQIKLKDCEGRNKFTTQVVPLKYGNNANYGICNNLFGAKLLRILPFSEVHGFILANDLVLSLHKSPIVQCQYTKEKGIVLNLSFIRRFHCA